MNKQPHVHSYDKIGLQTVMGDDSGTYRQNSPESAYTGDPMAILYHICQCGHSIAFEYGKRKAIAELVKGLTDAPPTKVPAISQ